MPTQAPRGCVLARGAGYHGKEARLSGKDSGALRRPHRDLWKTAFHQKAILTAIMTAAKLGCKCNNYFKTNQYMPGTLSHTVQHAGENSREKRGEAGKPWSTETGLEPSWRSGHQRQRWELFGLILKSAAHLSLKGSVRQTLSVPNIRGCVHLQPQGTWILLN